MTGIEPALSAWEVPPRLIAWSVKSGLTTCRTIQAGVIGCHEVQRVSPRESTGVHAHGRPSRASSGVPGPELPGPSWARFGDGIHEPAEVNRWDIDIGARRYG